MVTEVFSSDDFRAFSKNGFSTWSSQLNGILSPYKFFRVTRCDVEVMPSGGAASTYSIAFNVSNSSDADSGAASVLNDDYAAIATAMVRPKLVAPKAYWDGRPYDWYFYSNPGDPGFQVQTATAGVISLSGTGGASASTVIGYLIVDLEVEFHTLI